MNSDTPPQSSAESQKVLRNFSRLDKRVLVLLLPQTLFYTGHDKYGGFTFGVAAHWGGQGKTVKVLNT